MSRHVLGWFPAALLWAALCWHLSHHWEADPQYAFGWLVPALAIYLALRRYHTRPPAEAHAGPFPFLSLAASAAAFLPIWVVAQPNPDWRLVSWLFAVVVVVFTLSWCAVAGGRRWAWHFAIPACLILTAIPWPSAVESAVIQGLTRIVTGVAVEALNACGTLAVQHGNLIEVGTGVLGVNEACSGVRSFQASLMVALFLGEMLNVAFWPRIGLILISLGTALLGNAIRATLLAQAAAGGGSGALDRWHDSAGYSILTACLVVTWLVGLKFARSDSALSSSHTVAPRLPLGLAFVLTLYFAGIAAGTEYWFRSSARAPAADWRFSVPADAREVTEIPIDPISRDMLRYDRHRAVTWREPGGQRWVVYFFTWDSGPARSRILARMHRPDVCLTAAGHRLDGVRDPISLPVSGPGAGTQLPFDTYTFTSPSSDHVHVYYGLWENRATGAPVKPDTSIVRASLRAVRERERHLSQHVLEIALFDYASAAEADAAVRQRLPGLLTIPAPGAPPAKPE